MQNSNQTHQTGLREGTYTETEQTSELILPSGRVAPFSHGLLWLTQGFRLFMQQPLMWLLLTFTLFIVTVIALLLSVIPLANILVNVAMVLGMPIISAGLMAICDKIRTTGSFKLSDIFVGFKKPMGSLLTIGALSFVANTIGVLILLIFFIIAFGLLGFDSSQLFKPLFTASRYQHHSRSHWPIALYAHYAGLYDRKSFCPCTGDASCCQAD